MSKILNRIFDNTYHEVRSKHPFPSESGVDRLYKYIGSTLYIEDLFGKLNLHHSMPKDFNDPFECRAVIDQSSPHSAAEARRHLYKVCRNQGHSHKEANIFVSKAMSKENFIGDNLLRGLNDTYRSMKICSLTTDVSNLLMWSHYGRSHTGFCVEFLTKYFPFDMAYKVNYTNKYTSVNYPLRGNYDQLRIALEKSDHWQYEDEYRTLIIPGMNNYSPDGRAYKFEAEAISAVYLGLNISFEDKKLIIDTIKKSTVECSVYQAVLKQREYGVDFVEID